MRFKSLILSLLLVLIVSSLTRADYPGMGASLRITLDRLNRLKNELKTNPLPSSILNPEISDSSTSSEDLDKSQLAQDIFSENSLKSQSGETRTSVLNSLYVKSTGLFVYSTGNEPTVLIDADKEPGSVHITLRGTQLDPRFKLSQNSDQTDSSIGFVQVNAIAPSNPEDMATASVEITIKTDHKNWQLIPRQGGFVLSRLDSPVNSDISSSIGEQASRQVPRSDRETLSNPDTGVGGSEVSELEDQMITGITSTTEQAIAKKVSAQTETENIESSKLEEPIVEAENLATKISADSLTKESFLSDTVTPKNLDAKHENNIPATLETQEVNYSTEIKPISNNSSLSTPVQKMPFIQPSAIQLSEGEFSVNASSRLFFNSGDNSGSDTAYYPNFGFTWGITNDFQLSVEAQFLDSSGTVRQGSYSALRGSNSASYDVVLQGQQKLWESDDRNQFLRLVGALSIGSTNFEFSPLPGVSGKGQIFNDTILTPSLQIPYTVLVDNWQFMVAPSLSFFSATNAISLHQSPVANPGSFGTNFGLVGGIVYTVNPRLILWTDAFFPLIGNNSIERTSGQTAQTIIYNAGLRYMVNPRTGLDLFASNSYGSLGPLSFTGDRDYMALGTRLVVMPDWFSSNRRYPNSFGNQDDLSDSLPTSGFGFLDGGTVGNGKLFLNLSGGSQGIMTVARYGLFRDVELGVYLNYISGIVDESEQGLGVKVRFFNQSQGDPVTASVGITVSQTNQPFINFFNNNRNQFVEDGLSKGIPWIAGNDSLQTGRLFIVTGSFPIQYQFEDKSALWFTLILGYVQRSGGIQIAGFNLGGAWQFSSDFSLIGEVGANFTNPGNGFNGNNLTNIIPWTVGLRYDFASILQRDSSTRNNYPSAHLYLTNRVGLSPWQQLRVRNENSIAVGVGISIPIN